MITSDLHWYYFLLLITAICILSSVNITRSRLGRAFLTLRDNETAAAALGINIPLVKLRVVDDFLKLTATFNVKTTIHEVDNSSIFCEMIVK